MAEQTDSSLEQYLRFAETMPITRRELGKGAGLLGLLAIASLAGCKPAPQPEQGGALLPVPSSPPDVDGAYLTVPAEDGAFLVIKKVYQDELAPDTPIQTATGPALAVQTGAGVITDRPSTVITPSAAESSGDKLEINGRTYEAVSVGSASMDMTSRGVGAGYNATAVFNILHALRRATQRSMGQQPTILEPGVKVIQKGKESMAQVDYPTFFNSLGVDPVYYSLLVQPKTTFDFNTQTGPYLTVTDGYTEYPPIIVGGGVCDLATLMHYLARTNAQKLKDMGVSYKRTIQHGDPGINGFNAVDWVAILSGTPGYTFTMTNNSDQTLQMLFKFDPKHNNFNTNPDPVNNKKNIPPLSMTLRTLQQI